MMQGQEAFGFAEHLVPRIGLVVLGPTKTRLHTTHTISERPVMPLKFEEIVIPRWASYFQISEFRIGTESLLLSNTPVPGYAFRPGGIGTRLVENKVYNIGQLIQISAQFIGGENTRITCRMKEGMRRGKDYPWRWREIEPSTLGRLHPRNPHHQYEVSIPYTWEKPLPNWVEAIIDAPCHEEWLSEYGPDPVIEPGRLESISFCAILKGKIL